MDDKSSSKRGGRLVRLMPQLSANRASMAPGRGGGEGVRIRDHLANVRTFLSWVRAGLLLLALGYAVAKFGVIEDRPSRLIGLFTASAGWVVVIVAGFSFFRQRRAIEGTVYRPSVSWNVALTVLAALAGTATLVYLLRS
jgi:putative membrane protein